MAERRRERAIATAIRRFWHVITIGRLGRLRPIEVTLFLTGYVTLLMTGFALASAAIERVMAP